MDTLGPVIRLHYWEAVPGNWERQETCGAVLWQHRRRKLVFQVFPDDTARLVHVCDGAAPPDEPTQQHYGGGAILLELVRRQPEAALWCGLGEGDDDLPPWEDTPEAQAAYAAWCAEIEREEIEAWAAAPKKEWTELDANALLDPPPDDEIPF